MTLTAAASRSAPGRSLRPRLDAHLPHDVPRPGPNVPTIPETEPIPPEIEEPPTPIHNPGPIEDPGRPTPIAARADFRH
jgi:hypothetical protein